MKRTLLQSVMPVCCLFLLLTAIAPAQILFIPEKVITAGGKADSAYFEAKAAVANITNREAQVIVDVENITVPAGWDYSFCLGLCKGTNVVHWDDALLPDSTYDFHAIIIPNNIEGSGEMTAFITNKQDVLDRQSILFRLSAVRVGIPPLQSIGVFSLQQCYPNPFDGTKARAISFSFDMHRSSHVRMDITDITGRLVATLIDSDVSQGSTTVQWNAAGYDGMQAAPGMYLYRISAHGLTSTKKLLLLR